MPRTACSFSTRSGVDGTLSRDIEEESSRVAQNRGDAPLAFKTGVSEDELLTLSNSLERRGSKASVRLAHALRKQAQSVRTGLSSQEDGTVGFSLSSGSTGHNQGKGSRVTPLNEEQH